MKITTLPLWIIAPITLLILLEIGYFLFMLPVSNRVQKADAIVVFRGSEPRVKTGYDLAYWIRFDGHPPASEMANFKQTVIWIVSLKLSLFIAFDLYRGMWRYTGLYDIFNIVKACILPSGVIALIILFTTDEEVNQTRHKDIMVLNNGYVRPLYELLQQIDELIRLAQYRDDDQIKLKLCEIVPDYCPELS